jgi:hypothetical protein
VNRHTGLAGLAALRVPASTACHADDSGDGVASASPEPSTAPSAAAEQDALAAYRGMWTSIVEVVKASDQDDPALREHASDNALKLIVGGRITNRTSGKVTSGDLKTSPQAPRASPADKPASAEITDRVDATNWLEYNKSGGRWDDKPGGTHLTTAVSSCTLRKAGTC